MLQHSKIQNSRCDPKTPPLVYTSNSRADRIIGVN